MIEGINSSIATASLLRPVVEQETNARGQSASVEPVQRSPQAPYVSPYIFVDNANNKVILQIRDSESGDVVRQIPSDSQIRAYNKASDRPVQSESTHGADVVVAEESHHAQEVAAAVASEKSDAQSASSGSDSGASASSVLITA